MGYDIGRAVLAVCSVLVVLVAASAFPAAGFGSLPGGWDGGSGQGVGPGGDGPQMGGEPTPDPGRSGDDRTTTAEDGDETEKTTTTTTTTDPGGETTTEDSGDDRTTTDAGGEETTTETGSEETTTGATGPEPGEDDGKGGLLAALGALLGVLIAVLAWVAWTAAVVLFVGVAVFGIAMGAGKAAVESDAGATVLRFAGREVHVGASLQGVSRGTMSYVLALSAGTNRMLDDLGTTLQAAITGAGPALSTLRGSGSAALGTIARGLGTALAGGTRAAGGALLSLPSGLGALVSGVGGLRSGGSTPDRDARDTSPVPPSEEATEEPAPPESVEEAWTEFVETLRVRDPDTKTPAEFARIAVHGGLPVEPVRRLTETFREVRYGDVPPSGERVDAALSAFEEIRRRGGEES